jgi:EpsI family protein
VLPNPELQAKLDQLYTQLLARTYINAAGQRVMLSIAYGADQASDATAVHRPEFCYSSQGFTVRTLGDVRLDLQGHLIDVRHLLGRLGPRVEPITYWLTLNDRATLPGVGRKLAQLKIGLAGVVPDGMLIRASSIDSDVDRGFETHRTFLSKLREHVPSPIQARYFGKSA